MIEKLARGYIYTNKDKPVICAHNAEVAYRAGAFEAAQTWFMLESLLTNVVEEPTPPLSPLPLANPPLSHSASAPAAMSTLGALPLTPGPPHTLRTVTSDATTLVSIARKSSSPGSISKHSDGKPRRSTSGHRSPHAATPTSSNASSPRKPSTGLPNVPAAIFARRESGAGLPPPMRPRLPSSFRRPSFSTQSMHSAQSETLSEGARSHLSHKQYGEGALDDSDSDEGGSDGEGEDGEGEQHDDPPHTPARSARSPYGHVHAHRASIAHPSPLSRPAQTWTEDERDEGSSPSPGSTSEDEDESGDHTKGSDEDMHVSSRRPPLLRMVRRSSTRSNHKTRSRSSTVASFVASPSPSPSAGSSQQQRRALAKQDSQSSIRTVTVGEATPFGTLSRADLRREETARELSGGPAGSLRASSVSLHQRTKSEALSSEFFMDGMDDAYLDGMSDTPESGTRSQSDKTRTMVREVEARLRQMAWATIRERFEQYADTVRFFSASFPLCPLT